MRAFLNGIADTMLPTALTPPEVPASRADAGREHRRRWIEAVTAKHAPAFVVVDQHGEVLQRSGHVERYMASPDEGGWGQVISLVCADLRNTLRRLLDQSAFNQMPVRADLVPYVSCEPSLAGCRGLVDLMVEPMPDDPACGRALMIVFRDVDIDSLELDVGSSSAPAEPSHDKLRLMVSIVPAFLFTTESDMSVQDINQPFYGYTGLSAHQFRIDGWASVVHPDDMAEHRSRWQVALQQGCVFEQEQRLRRADGSWRWFLSRSSPERDAHGHVVRWFGSAVDIHDSRRDERKQRLLLAEVQHRAKNILAVVRSLLSRTLETAVSLEEFASHLSGRIAALARAQSVLGRTIDGLVDLAELAHQEVVAHGGQVRDQVSIQGPSVMLTDKTAETFGLALHELTTNALKFGALSVSEGKIKIRWKILPAEPDDFGATRLAFLWDETGMHLDPPQRGGFGRELIERGLPYELGARTRLQFRPRGVRCDIELLLKSPPDGGPLASDAA